MRIVCLSAESADICARLGAWDEVVAVTAFASQKGLVRRPVIGGFSTADIERVASYRPDLVITFSDVQAGIAAELIKAGLTVLASNQRTLSEIAQTIRTIGGAICRQDEGDKLAFWFLNELETIRVDVDRRPRIYFEEWPEPLISGIGWVSEIIHLTGGQDIFAHRCAKAARERMVTPVEIAAADPEIIVASWCGMPVNIEAIATRPGFGELTAVRNREVHALDSGIILQPGPRVLEGARRIRDIISTWQATS